MSDPTDWPEAVPIDALARLLGVTGRQARNLANDAGVTPTIRGRWPFGGTIRAVIAHARANKETDALAAARARVVNGKAKQIEMMLAEKERDLIPIEDAIDAQDVLAAIVLAELNGFPARVTRDLELRRQLRTEIEDMSARIVAALASAAEQARTGQSQE